MAAQRHRGMICNHKRVHVQGLVAKCRRVRTTDSHHPYPVAPNLLKRAFCAERPNEKWVADFTYIDTYEGWLYLALVMDVFSRKIVGWSMDIHRETSLVECALSKCHPQRKPKPGDLLHHSDRGGQYASDAYRALLHTYGITVSMSRTADPYDNALMESAIGTLKTECADRVFVSRAAARSAIFRYLEGWYHRKRLHSALGYLSPDQFEHQFFLDTLFLHLPG